MKTKLVYSVTLGVAVLFTCHWAYYLVRLICALAEANAGVWTQGLRALDLNVAALGPPLTYLLLSLGATVALYAVWDIGARLVRVEQQQEELLREVKRAKDTGQLG